MKPNVLLLPIRHTREDQAIWREAISLGWTVQRTERWRGHEHLYDGLNMVRFYGNTLDGSRLGRKLPCVLHKIDPHFLSNLPQSITGRDIALMRYKDLTQPIERDSFIKCIGDKWFQARVYRAGETIISSSKPDDWIYVQDIIDFQHEVRCFVFGGKIMTASFYRVDREYFPVEVGEQTCTEFIQPEIDKLYQLNPHLPDGVVLDYGYVPAFGVDEWRLIEANEAWASGLYCCEPDLAFRVITTSQSNRTA